MQGYALADRQIEVGLCSLAVPLLSRSGQVVAALNVGVPASAMSAAAKEKALAPLRRAAMALSLQL
jgi:IclR family pca regulon transcriptional regulator